MHIGPTLFAVLAVLIALQAAEGEARMPEVMAKQLSHLRVMGTPDNKCRPTIHKAVKCVMEHADKNHDGCVDLSEFQNTFDGLPWYLRPVVKALVGVDGMMERCDVITKDQCVTSREFMHGESCLSKCAYAEKAIYWLGC